MGRDVLPLSRSLFEQATDASEEAPDWHAVVECMLSRACGFAADAIAAADPVQAAFLRGQASRAFWDAYEVAAEASLTFRWESLEQLLDERARSAP